MYVSKLKIDNDIISYKTQLLVTFKYIALTFFFVNVVRVTGGKIGNRSDRFGNRSERFEQV